MKKNFSFLIIVFFIAFSFNSIFANTPEEIFCPDDITISCCQDYDNLEITGDPADINPQFNYFTKVDSLWIDECRVGTIKRIWTGHNNIGQFSCVQIITMERNDQFAGNIQWPYNWAGHCGDEIPYSEPQYDIGFCDQVAHTFKDDTFRFTPNACIKILRNWKVIDWCVYDPNSNSTNGLWEHTQILMITDKTAPKITECQNRTIKALNSDCSADFTLHKEANDNNCGLDSPLKWVFELDVNNDWQIDTTGTIDAQNADLELSGIPVGTHKIKWKVFDGCANVSTCMETIRVVDGKAPTLYCYLSTTENLVSGDDSLRFPAKNFVKDAYDNCTAKENLIFSYSPDPKDSVKVFTCWDLGYQFLRIFAIDEAGNSDFAYILTRVSVHEPCSYYPLIQGSVVSMQNQPVKNINIGIEGKGNLYLINKTDAKGNFSFLYKESEVQPKLRFIPGYDYVPDINVNDLKLIIDYLLGKIELNEYERFSADINDDGKISAADIVVLRKILLGLENPDSLSKAAKFFIKDKESNTFKEIKYIENLKEPIKVYCAMKGDVR